MPSSISPAHLTLEHVACDLCGADDAVPVGEVRDVLAGTTDLGFRLVRCRQCGLLYLDPRPAAADLQRFYPEDYAPFSRHGLAGAVKTLQMRRQVERLWPYLEPPNRVLDLGCATGELLQTVRKHGNANVLGIEPSEQAAAIARQRYRLDVRTGDLFDAHLDEDSIDVALLSHVIEHLPSPSATIAELSRVMSLQATLILWLPNGASLAARALGRNWIGYDAPRHLYTFTLDTLAGLLDRHGFVVREITHEAIGLEWSWALRLLARERWPDGRVDRALARLHPILTAAFTPLAGMAAVLGQAGRIQVIAGRRRT